MKITESTSRFQNLEQMTVMEILQGINQEDSTVHLAVLKELGKIEQLVQLLVQRMSAGGRLFYLGAGTSGRLGVLDAAEIPPSFGVPPGMVVGLIAGGERAIREAVESVEDDETSGWKDLVAHKINRTDTVVGIAASGTTPYVIGGLRKAREHGLLTAGITCNPDSDISKVAEIMIEPVVGPEFVTGSTRMKAGTAEKMVLNMISTATMIRLGRVKGNKMVDMELNNRKLVERGTGIIMEETGMERDQARRLLLIHGSVRKAIEQYRNETPEEE